MTDKKFVKEHLTGRTDGWEYICSHHYMSPDCNLLQDLPDNSKLKKAILEYNKSGKELEKLLFSLGYKAG